MPSTQPETVQQKNSSMLHWTVFCVAAAIMVIADQWLKLWSTANLAGGPRRVLVEGFLGLTYFHNTGAAFGLLGNFTWGRWALTAFVILALMGIIWYFNRLPSEKKMWLLRVPLVLIFAGGLGNLIDRVRLGFVVDMLEFLFINFAIFNLADVFVTTGIFLLIPVSLYMGKDMPWPFGERRDV